MASRFRFRLCALAAAAAAFITTPAAAQDAPQTVTVTARTPQSAAISGFDGVPLSRAPFSATVIGPSALQDAGVSNLADVARASSGLGDAYNPIGYWSNFTVRGYVLDQRSNFRRDGLPISAETSLWLGNKHSVEVLRGTSGLQAGVSAPGGLVNLTVKRPAGSPLRSATLGVESDGTAGVLFDLGNRAGPDGTIGWRVSAEATHLDPPLRAARGHREGIAAAVEWRPDADHLLEAEIELNRQSQPSQPAFSLLGSRVPDARDIDPRINLNNQPWSLPVVFVGQTGSLRWTQRLSGDLTFIAHAMTQRLRTDDRVAFPFGCSDNNGTPADPDDDIYYADRYCPNGTFDFYDFRSEGEHRRSNALDLSLGGRTMGFGGEHRWRAGLLGSRLSVDAPRSAFNPVGTGTIDGLSIVPPDATADEAGSNSENRSLEAYVRDQWLLTPDATLWLGLRRTLLKQYGTDTDGSYLTDTRRHLTTPWAAASLQINASTMVYASAGQGVETPVTPSSSQYANPGQPLPPQKSRQLEAGIKLDTGPWTAGAVAFDIRRPFVTDGACTAGCVRIIDGLQRHRGIELDAGWQSAAWWLQAGGTWLRTRRERSADPANDALQPTNVPERSVRVQLGFRPAAMPGLSLSATAAHEGSRFVLRDNSASIPSWTRLDLAARLVQQWGDTALTWRLGVDNATNRRAWREAPLQFDHAFLYPLAPRTWRASVQAAF